MVTFSTKDGLRPDCGNHPQYPCPLCTKKLTPKHTPLDLNPQPQRKPSESRFGDPPQPIQLGFN